MDSGGPTAGGLLLAALLLLAACQAPWDNPAPTPTPMAKPVITPKQADKVFRKLYGERSTAIASRNVNALPGITSSAALLREQGFIRALVAEGQTTNYPELTNVTVAVPRQTQYPAWFMSIATGSEQGGTGWELDEVSRQAGSASWKIDATAGFVAKPPLPLTDAGGYASVGTLRRDPSKDVAAFLQAAAHGQPTTNVANTGDASSIANDDRQEIVNTGNLGWAFDIQVTPGGGTGNSIKLRDGSSLAVAWASQTAYFASANGACFTQPDSSGTKWDPQIANGTYKSGQFTRTIILSVVEPATGDDQVLGSQLATSSVSTQAC